MVFRKLNYLLTATTGYRFTRDGAAQRIVADPREASYHYPRTPVGHGIRVPLKLGFEFNAFSLGSASYHPWITAIRLSDSLKNEELFKSILRRYYFMVQPKSLREWLEIPDGLCPELDSMPLFAWGMLPWTLLSPSEFLHNVEAAHFSENKMLGLNKGTAAGEKAFGPLSSEKFDVEAQRIATLFKSIKKVGLVESHSDYPSMSAMFLVEGDRWVWRSTGGMHRIAVACAAGINKILVRISAVVRREEVDLWPQVQTGLYDRDTALALFDRMMARRPPKCAQSWVDWVDTQRGF